MNKKKKKWVVLELLLIAIFLSFSNQSALAQEDPKTTDQGKEIWKETGEIVSDTSLAIVNFLSLKETHVSVSRDKELLKYTGEAPNPLGGYTITATVVIDMLRKKVMTELNLSSKTLTDITFVTPNVKKGGIVFLDHNRKIMTGSVTTEQIHKEARMELIWLQVLAMDPEKGRERYFYHTDLSTDRVHVGTAVVTPNFRSLVYHNYHEVSRDFMGKSRRTTRVK